MGGLADQPSEINLEVKGVVFNCTLRWKGINAADRASKPHDENQLRLSFRY